jgi:hypothetical protein
MPAVLTTKRDAPAADASAPDDLKPEISAQKDGAA